MALWLIPLDCSLPAVQAYLNARGDKPLDTTETQLVAELLKRYVHVSKKQKAVSMKKESDLDLFNELLRLVQSDDLFDRFDFYRVIEANAATMHIKGLLAVEHGADTWWPYDVDRKRLRAKDGPKELAREFMAGFRAARDNYKKGEAPPA